MDKILKNLNEKYIKDREFKRDFDENKEKAIKKHFGKETLDKLKLNSDKVLKFSISSFLDKKKELDEASLENIAGGKNEENKKQITTIKHVDVIKEETINDIKMEPTVKGNLNINKGTFNDF